MGNCLRSKGNGVDQCRYTQPQNYGGPEEGVKIISKKLIAYPLPLPPPHISTYAQKLPSPSPSPMHENEIVFSPRLKSFTFNELRYATKYFCPSGLLGEGGFGYVFKGWLDEGTLSPVESGSGMAVAVKKLKPKEFQGHKEWLSEITYLGQLAHPNLVKLYGFCSEGENKLLVCEFMHQGSLKNHLFKRSAQSLSWALRIKVAVEAARGLFFLHASASKIIYRDFKSSNILLDKDYNVKLSDFGLAKDGPTGDLTHVSTQVMGTQGYTAPEYMATGGLTPKCDVYSFGIVLLELITGRLAIDNKRCAVERNLLEWVRPQLRDPKKLFRIMDIKLEGRYSRKDACLVANLALQCCHMEATYRPHMSEVLSILERIPSSKANRHQGMSSSKSIINANGLSNNTQGRSRGSSMPMAPQGSPSMPHI